MSGSKNGQNYELETQYEHTHSKQMVSPNHAGGILLTSGGGAWADGAFSADIIAAGVVTKPFDIHGIDVEAPSANASYQIDLYGIPIDDTVETLIGSATFTRTNATTVSRSTTMITKQLKANSRLRAKMADSTGGNTCTVKVWFHVYG